MTGAAARGCKRDPMIGGPGSQGWHENALPAGFPATPSGEFADR
jgi:hypothetical protein